MLQKEILILLHQGILLEDREAVRCIFVTFKEVKVSINIVNNTSDIVKGLDLVSSARNHVKVVETAICSFDAGIIPLVQHHVAIGNWNCITHSVYARRMHELIGGAFRPHIPIAI